MNRILFGILVVVTTSLMGSSFAVGKIGLAYFSPLLLVGLRFTLAGLIMGAWVWKKPLPKSAGDWGKLCLIGFLQTAAVMGCIFLSLRTITAGESSILTFMNPLLVVIWGTLFLGISYRLTQWMGVLIGLVGVFITLGFHLQWETGTLFGIGSALAWSIATILVKKWGVRFNVWVMTAYQMLFGGILLLVIGFTLETPKLIVTPTAVFVVLWLAIMASIVQFATWFYLLNYGDPGRTSAFLFLAPFFGVLSGWLLLGEVVQWHVYMGGLLIFAGIFLVNWTFAPRRQMSEKAQLAE
ncbi:EamA family transporter [Brevibacillus sp. HB1.1]|uniref:DMT family transporter n=1 Tax=Brevibacillus sp. HB1.1 TaxID=2738808 RepID=UPI001576EBB9|nr:DMT family transporter [Brevibacillus sp. HB1.1]NTU31871.1 EamA family transporter [Brevibacillus sp. HB1.1]